MVTNDLPEPVKDLLARSILSITQLELLLFLRKHNQTSWSSEEVSAKLYTNASAADLMLRDLCRAGLLQQTESGEGLRFNYDSSNEAVESSVSLLAESYRLSKTRVVECIFRTSPKTESDA